MFQDESRIINENQDYINEQEDLNEERYQVLEDIKGKLIEWINEAKTVKYIKKSFYLFLMSFQNQEGSLVYQEKIKKMCKENAQSIEVNYQDLSEAFPAISFWIFESPGLILGFLN